MIDLNELVKREDLRDEDYIEFINQGMKLLNKFISNKGYGGMFDDDEKYDMVYFSVVKALANWDNKKSNKFTTYFSAVIKNRICCEVIQRNRGKNRFFNSCLSFDSEFNYKQQDSSDDVTSISDKTGRLDLYELEIFDLINNLSNQERCVIELLLQGYTNSEIAEKLSTTYSSVTSSLSKARKTIKRLYYK